MKETTRDDMWGESEAEPESEDEFDAVLAEAEPVELTVVRLSDIADILLAQTALLMRLYDANMALLASVDEDEAGKLWDLHEKGGHRNPQLMIPSITRDGPVA